MSFAHFEITLGQVGGPDTEIIINDEKFTACKEIQINSAQGEVTQVHMNVFADAHLDGEGIINLYHPLSGTALVDVLNRLKPSEIDELAMERMGWDDKSLAEVILEIIKEKVREAQPDTSSEVGGITDGVPVSDN